MTEHLDLHAGARRGLVWSSAGCLGGALAVLGLALDATDDVHHLMFGTLAGSLVVAAAVLEVVRRTLQPRSR